MSKQWRRYIHLIANRDNLYSTTLASAIVDNGGTSFAIAGTFSSIITLQNIEVEPLDNTFVANRISNESHLRTFGQTDLKTCYRITFPDGQRLIYVQCADCHASFLVQDSHASFDKE